MIKLTKTAKPSILVTKAASWTATYLADTSNENARDRYRHKDIKDALEKETYKKCAYCESKIAHFT